MVNLVFVNRARSKFIIRNKSMVLVNQGTKMLQFFEEDSLCENTIETFNLILYAKQTLNC